MGEIKVGTCGYSYYNPPDGWKDEYESKLQAYSEAFEVVEINRTFYKLPMVKTAERWRREAFEDFEFTIKAWQAITHYPSSPTYRRSRLDDDQKQQCGGFQPTDMVWGAWDRTREIAEILDAPAIVFQCPASLVVHDA